MMMSFKIITSGWRKCRWMAIGWHMINIVGWNSSVESLNFAFLGRFKWWIIFHSKNHVFSAFMNKPENKTLLEGEFTFLGCYMDGAKISWKHNGDDVSSSSNTRFTVLYNGYLSINNIQEKDSGIYTCIAHHETTGCIRSTSSFVQVIKPANVQKGT